MRHILFFYLLIKRSRSSGNMTRQIAPHICWTVRTIRKLSSDCFEELEVIGNGCSLELFFDNDQTFVGTEGRN
uniref:Uncharacterized protein n=1 Tax=Globodera rostochiensis TaxID=31243 RepID=A0A914HNM1_GLORO